MSDHLVEGGQRCPSCGASVASVASVCWTCGHELAVNETAQAAQPEEPEQIPLVDWTSPDGPSPAPMPPTLQAREAVPAKEGRTWSLALIGGAGVAVCVLAMVVMQSLQPVASEPPPMAAAPSASPAPTVAPVADSAPAPTWVGNRQASWANDGSKTISFEVRATNDVTVWMARVRPLLVVRGRFRTADVFVARRWAAGRRHPCDTTP